MKRVLALVAPALLLAACGNVTDTCNGTTGTDSVAVTELQGQCTTLAANQSLTISLRACPTCADANLRCVVDAQPGGFLLDSQADRCSSTGCPTACAISPVPCQVGALAPGTYTVLYNTTGQAGGASTTITVQPGGVASCTL